MRKFHGYLKPWEVSTYLGIPVEEIRAMIDSGELPSTTVNGEARIPWDRLEQWLDEEVDPDALTDLSRRLRDVDPDQVQAFIEGAEEG